MVCTNGNLVERRRKIVGNLRSKMRRYGLSPVIGSWMLSVLGGTAPRLEEVRTLRLNQMQKSAYKKQNTVGWRQLAKGRVPREVEKFQEKWAQEYGTRQQQKCMKAGTIISKSIAMSVIAQYGVWKTR